MGRADSLLHERVIFVEGAPRSGTTWLVTLLATHPEIAGVDAESHLFDFGVDRLFDNFEYRDEHLHGLARYVHRDEMVDLVRDLCDGVLAAMRRRVSAGAEAPFVVEKTPIRPFAEGRDLARKAECYPDAWYLHIVRDREAVVRSLMRSPWMIDRSYKACARVWDDAVEHARASFAALPHYREVSYEELRRDPVEGCRALFEWLGVDAGLPVLETMGALSREQFSDLGAVGAGPPPSVRVAVRRMPGRMRKRIHDVVTRAGPAPPGSAPAFRFVEAFHQRDVTALRAVTSPSIEVTFRSPEEDLLVRGDDGRAALTRLSEEAFGVDFVGEWWGSAGGEAPWWTSISGKTTWTVLFSGLRGDATRVDCAIGLIIENELVSRVVVISAGPLEGRTVAPLHEPSPMPR